MAYQEVKTTGYGTRVGNSFKGIVSGLLLFVLGTCLLWWNEGRAVKTAKMLDEAEGLAVHAEDIKSLDTSLNGQLIHANGTAETIDSLSDATFSVGVTALKLVREVEYYQWVESSSTQTKEKIGGSKEEVTTYSYKKAWTSKPVNSADFKDPEYQDKNSVKVQFDETTVYAENVKFGAYTLPERMVKSIGGEEPLILNIPAATMKQWDIDMAKTLGDKAAIKAAQIVDEQPSDSVSSGTSITGSDNYTYVHSSDNIIYFGRSMISPEVGDVKVTFSYIKPHDISIIAQVAGSTFQPFTAKNGKSLLMVQDGTVAMDQMFQGAEEGNNMLTWILRIVGILIVIGGLRGIFDFLVMILKVLPFLASIMNFGVGLICGVVGFAWSLLVIALAWFFYRPILSVCILAVIGGVVFYFIKRGKDKKKATQEVPAE